METAQGPRVEAAARALRNSIVMVWEDTLKGT